MPAEVVDDRHHFDKTDVFDLGKALDLVYEQLGVRLYGHFGLVEEGQKRLGQDHAHILRVVTGYRSQVNLGSKKKLHLRGVYFLPLLLYV